MTPKQLPGAIAYENLLLNPSYLLTRSQNLASQQSAAVLWRYVNGDGAGTTSIGSFTWNQAEVPGFPRNYLEYQITTAPTGTNRATIGQRLEGVRSFAGQTITLAWWVWSSVNWSNCVFQSFQSFGTGGSPSSSVTITSAGINLTANIWQRCTATFALPSVASATLGTNNNDFVQFAFRPSTGVVGTLRFANAGLYLGAIAPTFQERSIQLERDLCSRYWQKVPVIFDGNVSSGTSYTASGLILPMRSTPTLTATNVSNTNFGATPSVGYQSSNGEAWIEDTRAATATGRGRIVSIVECTAEL